MAKKQKLTLEKLLAERAKMEQEVTETQQALADKTYQIDFEYMPNINAILTHIDKSYKWTLKNAALVINLHTTLRTEKNRIAAEKSDSNVVSLKAVDLNTLYVVLTSVEGTGVEAAKRFVTLLTNVGKQITDAMQEMADSNKSIQTLHVELAELDGEIEKMKAQTIKADEIIEQE